MKKFLLCVSFILFAGLSALASAAKRPMEVEDLFRFKRVSEPQVSPDGQWVAYVVGVVLKAENRVDTDIWLIPAGHSTGSGQGGDARRLTQSPKHDRHPRWSPDGQWIVFESNRDGEDQLWIIPAAGGEARKLTTLSTGATRPVWSPDGKALGFVSEVFPEFSAKPFAEADKLNKEKQAARDTSKVKARVITQLLYRHWDSWVDDKRKHVFVLPMRGGEAAGEPRNATPGDNDAVPTSSTFEEGDEFAFSPDGKTLVFAAPHHVTREQAWTTNHDLWSVDLATGERRQLTTSLAAEGHPVFSPDGKLLAYRAQSRPGHEADRWQLRILSLNSGENWSVTEKFDSAVNAVAWTPDGKELVFGAQEKGEEQLWAVEPRGGDVRRIAAGGVNTGHTLAGDGRYVFYTHARLTRPQEVWRLDRRTGATEQFTRTNDDLLAQIDLPRPESVTVTGTRSTGSGQAAGDPVQMWVLRPPGFDAAKKYPLVFWVHGGPQGVFADGWSTRWNASLWAAQGYVVALPNPRGSTSFGQKFTDEISRDWGGKIFEDLMACLAHLEKQPFIDTTRMAAAGASYGGYMMNWFQGHTDKFRTLVTHCGVYNFESMYGVTEEVWFSEWETGKPWENPEQLKWSPHRHAAKFRTPNLIIHNELDFRVPIGEGLQLFTALQRQGVPSKLLYFPDEGHWVNKPQNSELWHRTIFDWLADYLKK